MITIFVIILIVNMFVYFAIRDSEDIEKDKRIAFRNYFFLSSMIYILVIFYLRTHKGLMLYEWFIYTSLAIVLFIFFAVIRKVANSKVKLEAKQMSYWDIDVDLILDKYKHRIVKKKGRNEVEVEENEYFIDIDRADGSKKLKPIIVGDIKTAPNLKIVKDVNTIRESANQIHAKLLNKLEEINEDAELGVDFEEKLKENKNILEFFFIDLWESMAFEENTSSTTLYPLAQNEYDIELLGALASAKSINVQKDGIVLFAHYLNFKGRV